MRLDLASGKRSAVSRRAPESPATPAQACRPDKRSIAYLRYSDQGYHDHGPESAHRSSSPRSGRQIVERQAGMERVRKTCLWRPIAAAIMPSGWFHLMARLPSGSPAARSIWAGSRPGPAANSPLSIGRRAEPGRNAGRRRTRSGLSGAWPNMESSPRARRHSGDAVQPLRRQWRHGFARESGPIEIAEFRFTVHLSLADGRAMARGWRSKSETATVRCM